MFACAGVTDATLGTELQGVKREELGLHSRELAGSDVSLAERWALFVLRVEPDRIGKPLAAAGLRPGDFIDLRLSLGALNGCNKRVSHVPLLLAMLLSNSCV